MTLLDSAENTSDTVIYAMDETYVRLESQNRRSWSPKGISPILERNNPHIGVNIVGASQICGSFQTFADIYSSEHSITNKEVRNFFDYLLEINNGKKVYIIMDNAATHTCAAMQKYLDSKPNLFLLNLPPYSPDLNPQENLWNRLKNCIFSNRARANIFELFNDIVSIYDKLNQNTCIEKSVTYARNYYA